MIPRRHRRRAATASISIRAAIPCTDPIVRVRAAALGDADTALVLVLGTNAAGLNVVPTRVAGAAS